MTSPTERAPEWLWVAGSLAFYAPLALAVLWWLGPERWSVWGTAPARDLGLGLVAALAVVGGTRLGVRVFPALDTLTEAMREQLGPVSAATVAVLALCSGIAEELLFRGLLQPWLGIPTATVLFALVHVPMERRLWAWPLFALVFGALAAGMTAFTGGITAAVTAHVVTNALNLAWIARSAPPDDGETADAGPRA